jgi:hypothetical protein
MPVPALGKGTVRNPPTERTKLVLRTGAKVRTQRRCIFLQAGAALPRWHPDLTSRSAPAYEGAAMAGTHDAAPLGYCILPVASSASIPRTPNDRKQAD